MRISNQTPAYQPAAQPRRASSGSGSFGKQLDIAALRSTDHFEASPLAAKQTMDELKPSAYLTLMYSYDAWKAKQPPKELPDSWGATEENLAYLKEQYSGGLSWEERVDALETMRQLGVISLDQMNKATGSEFLYLDATTVHVTLNEKVDERRFSDDWGTYFSKDPISTFKTADDLFAWLDQILEKENV